MYIEYRMSELGETPSPSEEITIPSLPDIKFFDKIAGEDIEKKVKDTIYAYWQTFGDKKGYLEHLQAAAEDSAVPKLERDDCLAIHRQSEKDLREINETLIRFVHRNPVKHLFFQMFGGSMEYIDASILITNYRVSQVWQDMALALCEAIKETRDLNAGPEGVLRLKIAQFAVEDLHNLISYKRVQTAAQIREQPSTVKDFKTEKDKLVYALKRELWDEERTKQVLGTYRESVEYVNGHSRELRWDKRVGENMTILLRCAEGNIPPDTSAVDILETEQLALQWLCYQRAFELPNKELTE